MINNIIIIIVGIVLIIIITRVVHFTQNRLSPYLCLSTNGHNMEMQSYYVRDAKTNDIKWIRSEMAHAYLYIDSF